jgi:carboxyl-terminal processing protease
MTPKSHFKLYVLPTILAGLLIAGTFSLGVYIGSRHAMASLPLVTTSSGAKVDIDAFWKAWGILNERFVGDAIPKDQDKVYGAIAGLAASYKDPYTVFFPPVESKAFNEQVSGAFEGVGMEVDIKAGVLTVVAPIKDAPADKAGMLTGDHIIKIDGKNTAGLAVEDAIKLIKGKKGTTVVLTVIRASRKDPFDVSIVRDTIDIPSTKAEMRKDGIFVISIYSFSAPSYIKFREALRQFVEAKSDKLIIDLRNNPGGYLEAAVDIGSWFLPQGSVIVSEDYGKAKEPLYHRSTGYNIFNDKLKLIILINGGSASASEILAGALHDHNKARLLGEKSFGKGSVQELIPITSDTSLKVTIARWLTPNGTSISHQGIVPDIVVPMTFDDFKAKGDIQMAKAVETLLKESATSSTAYILNAPQFTVTGH